MSSVQLYAHRSPWQSASLNSIKKETRSRVNFAHSRGWEGARYKAKQKVVRVSWSASWPCGLRAPPSITGLGHANGRRSREDADAAASLNLLPNLPADFMKPRYDIHEENFTQICLGRRRIMRDKRRSKTEIYSFYIIYLPRIGILYSFQFQESFKA